jgi:GTP-binding protein
VILVDLASVTEVAPQRQEEILLTELGRYQPELLRRPRVVVGSKADQADAAGIASDWQGRRISAMTGEGLPELVGTLGVMVAEARAAAAALAADTFVIHRPVPEGVVVERGGDGAFVVLGRPALRAVALSDLNNATALAYAQGRLRRLGVDRALARAGARQGDTVRIGTFVFEYEPNT